MKKNIILICLLYFFSMTLIAETVKNLIDNNNFYINCNEKVGDDVFFLGDIVVKNGVIDCLYSLSNEEILIENDTLVIYAEKHFFSKDYETDDIPYRYFYYPKRYKITITTEDILEALNSEEKIITKYIDTNTEYPTQCQAILVDSVDVREEATINSKIIGRIEKRTEVTLYEESKNIDLIDNQKSSWYKVKLNNGKFGWIFGAYAKIFFEQEYMGKFDKAGILKSIK